jgi:hypothetical protein
MAMDPQLPNGNGLRAFDVHHVLDVPTDVGNLEDMTVRHFPSYSEARANLRGVLDAANTGVVTTLERDHTRFAVVDGELLRSQLAALRPAHAVVTAEGGGWSAFLPGLPIAGEGEDLDAAIDDLIDALRDYASDWNDRLHVAANHEANWAVAALVELSTDEQLRDWLLTIDTITEQ